MTESLYSKLYNPHEIAQQRVVERFDGDALDDRWTYSNIASSPETGMQDVVDGGYIITTGAVSLGRASINFNGIDQYDETACRFIAVVRCHQTDQFINFTGMTGNPPDAGLQYLLADADSTNGVYSLRTKNTSFGNTNTSVSIDTNPHVHRVEMKNSVAIYHIEGIQRATRTTFLPNIPLEPIFKVSTQNSTADSCSISYFEVYNT